MFSKLSRFSGWPGIADYHHLDELMPKAAITSPASKEVPISLPSDQRGWPPALQPRLQDAPVTFSVACSTRREHRPGVRSQCPSGSTGIGRSTSAPSPPRPRCQDARHCRQRPSLETPERAMCLSPCLSTTAASLDIRSQGTRWAAAATRQPDMNPKRQLSRVIS